MVLQTSFLDCTLTHVGYHEQFLPDKKGRQGMARLADYGTIERDNSAESLDDVLGLELEISNVEVRHGNFGEFVRFEALDNRGKTHTVSTGAFLVVDALKDAMEQGVHSVSARFIKKGRTYRFE